MRPEDTSLLQIEPIEDNMLVQINSENKFIGSLLWKVADFLSFGIFEKKKPVVQSNEHPANKTEKSIIQPVIKAEKKKLNDTVVLGMGHAVIDVPPID